MDLGHLITLAFSICLVVTPALNAQNEASRVVAGGGISVPQWTGKIDAGELRMGRTLNDAKLTKDGDTFHVVTGPAVAYWSPANKASGVKATFNEPKYMNLNSHPHPYGIFIAGTEMGTANQSCLYCAAYGHGRFIVRGFGPSPFQMKGFQGEANQAVHTAAGWDNVTQEIALSVKGDRVECSINGAVVTGYDKAALVTAGKIHFHRRYLWPTISK